jgi:hypothetical protein
MLGMRQFTDLVLQPEPDARGGRSSRCPGLPPRLR